MPAQHTETESGRKQCQHAILAALIIFALALCAVVVVMMLLRGPAVNY